MATPTLYPTLTRSFPPVRHCARVRSAILLSLSIIALFAGSSSPAFADPPAGYYDSAIGLTGAPLASALHTIIDDHLRIPYTSSSTDTWDVLAIANANPLIPGDILTVYRNRSVDATDHSSGTGFNREHTWPSSYGFTDDGGCNYPYTDLHHLMPADWGYNTARGNRVYDFCTGSCDLWPVDGAPTTPNRGTGFGNTGSWEAWPGKRGDVARALLYLAVRYEGGTHGVTGCTEPDLILTNNRNLIVSNTNQNYSPAYMGELSTLLLWHLSDPVDDFERDRNDVIFNFQGNRNPFVDHPEWACMVFQCPGGDPDPPSVPTGVLAIPGDCSTILAWGANSEFDLDGYRVLRATGGGAAQAIHSDLLTDTSFVDTTALNGVSYTYSIVAVDLAGNESAPSTPAVSTPNGSGACGAPFVPWVNELHYDNVGIDQDEGVEIAGPAGADLSGWLLLSYEGAGGTIVGTTFLTGTLPDQSNGFGALWFSISGLRNTGPAGIALVDGQGEVIEFLGYEGSFTATTGVASGQTAVDIGVVESSSTPVGTTLQLVGTGSRSSDFTWVTSLPFSEASPNTGQFLSCPAGGEDCNGNGVDDACEIATGQTVDLDQDGIPDSCASILFLRGDGNRDGARDISDAIFALGVLFGGTTPGCLDALDSNDDDVMNIADAIFLLAFFFSGEAAPPPPTAGCGVDPTPDALDCAAPTNCP